MHTFVVLAYKESAFLEECIKSCLNQSLKTRVVIATSTPNEYIKKIAKKYKLDIIVNKSTNKGIGYDFDFAINCISSILVTVAHQDDIYDYEYTENVVKMYNKYNDASMIFPDYYEVRNGQKVFNNKLLLVKRLLRSPLLIKKISHLTFIKRLSIRFGCSIMCPSITFVQANIPGECYASDYKLNVDWKCYERLSKYPGRWCYINKALMGHRIHEESTTSKYLEDRTKEDYESFCWFWPSPIAKFINHFYKTAQKSNSVKK